MLLDLAAESGAMLDANRFDSFYHDHLRMSRQGNLNLVAVVRDFPCLAIL
jgi:hypothetical protein